VRAALALCALALAPWAAAWDLSVDPSGGPLVLVDHVEAALADWSAAGADVEATDRSVVVRYGDPERLGPDAIVLVVVRPDAGSFELLVHPDLQGVRAALIPALGVVLGGVPGGGALDPRVDVATPRVPTATDVAALRAGRPAVPGDLDGDGRVGFEDLLRLAAAYGRQGINLPEDLDGDGVVGDADLDLLREAYAFEGTPGADDATTPEPAAAPADAPTEAPAGEGAGDDAPETDDAVEPADPLEPRDPPRAPN
jgi:hypothetical protein